MLTGLPMLFLSRVQIAEYQPQWSEPIADLFYLAVHAIEPGVYSPEQQQAWAPKPDYLKWQQRLANKRPFVALIQKQVVGFLELEPDGHIDCAYTHPEFQRQGVAAALLKHAEKHAQKAGLSRLFLEASKNARPFFEKQGFTCLHENEVTINNQTLINFVMEKYL